VKRLLALAAVVAMLLVAVTTPAAPAAAATQCGDGNHWCVGAERKHNRLFLIFAGFGYHGSYRVCVTPPKAKEVCRTFGLVPNGTGANASSVLFTKHFPHARKGQYHVRWIYAGKQVGKSMAFTP
jgi:hypothetical protein